MVEAAGHQHRVLVIDDDHDLREVMVRRFAAQGWEVTGAAEGREALGSLIAGPYPCVAFLDLMMPGMDGWRFMSELRVWPTLRTIPIVVVSAYGSRDGVQWLGAADYLRKPLHLAHAIEIVRRLCPLDAHPGAVEVQGAR